MRRPRDKANRFELRVSCEVARRIRQHARSSTKTEICGVLIGADEGGSTIIDASIPGANAVQGGTHVTFTQETWEHIYRVKDRDYPNARIVGWYHSHPGFGVFLSDHDTFIHKNFFSAERQVAWVFDPLSDEEGCFGWVDSRLERLTQIVFIDHKGGEGAGETGKPEPALPGLVDDEMSEAIQTNAGTVNTPLGILSAIATYLIVFLAGALLSWFFFPHLVGIPVDPITGKPLLSMPSDVDHPAQSPAPSHAIEPAQPGISNPPPSEPATKPGQPAAKGKP